MSTSCRSLNSYTVTTSRSDLLTYVTGQFRRSLVMTIGKGDEYILLQMDIPISPTYVTLDIKFSDTAVTYHNVLYIIVRRIQSCKKASYRSSSYARRHFCIFLYPVRLSKAAWKTTYGSYRENFNQNSSVASSKVITIFQSGSARAIWRLILRQLRVRKPVYEIELVSSIVLRALTMKHIWVILRILT